MKSRKQSTQKNKKAGQGNTSVGQSIHELENSTPKPFLSKVKSFIQERWPILIAFFLFSLLLARNPYSERTLIPNLEPYPDSIHYIKPALSFLRGEGLVINREGRHLLPTVPALYSIVLIPLFAVNSDVRTFYVLNVFMAFVSLILFYLITKKTFPEKKFLQFFLLFLYVTNYVLYWFPELAMAESLLLPLTLGGVYALLFSPNKKTALIIPALAISFYATKFSALPLSAAVIVLFIAQIVLVAKDREYKKRIFGWFLLSFTIASVIYMAYEYFGRGNLVALSLAQLVFRVFSPQKVIAASQGKGDGGYFSLQYVARNVEAYGRWLIGDPITILYKPLKILPKLLAIPAVVGLLISLVTKKRWTAIVWLGTLASTILFLMTFYVADGRYFLVAIPALIFGLGLFLEWVENYFARNGRLISEILFCLFFLFYLVTQAQRIKFDVMLNLRHSENPWYYISVRTFDNYLAEHKSEFQKEPVIISALPPYIIDFYAKQPMLVLPLSPDQEFTSHQQAAWGDHNYQDLPAEYKKYLAEGRAVFLTQYGLGNEKNLHVAYDALFQTFTLKKVVSGCYSVCDVYQITGVAEAQIKK
jgi:hypothetical protein